MGMQLTGSLSISGSIVTTGVVNAGSVTATGKQYVSDTTVPTNFDSTAAIYTDGGMRVTKNVYLSSSLYLKGDLTVYGTQSINYITSSQLDISDNIINVNTATPGVRFGGIAVYDSGSTGLTGSFLWDSQNNKWIYSNPSGSGYDGGMAIFGPRNTSGLGSEQGTTNNALMKGQGGDHVTSSLITEDGALMSVYSTMYVSSSGNVGIGTSTPTSKLSVNGTIESLTDAASEGGQFLLRGNTYQYTIDNYSGTGLRIIRENDSTGASGTVLMFISSSGNIGMGTTAPSYKLDVSGNIRATGAIYANANGALYFQGGDDVALYDINVANTMGVYGVQDSTVGSIKLGSGGGIISGYNGSIGIGTTSPVGSLQVRKNFWQLYNEKTHTSNANFLNVNFNSLTGAAIVRITHASYKAGVNTYSAIITYYLNYNGVTLSVDTVTASGAGSPGILGTSTAGGGSVTFYFVYSGSSNNWSNAAIEVQAVSNNITEQTVSVTLL